jgi:DNA-directed RNA polymerase subunit beta
MANSTANKERVSFGKIRNMAESPDLLDIQLQSFRDFFQLDTTPENRNQEGLYRVFTENFPISDTRNIFVLEFLDYFVDPPRYSMDECIERGLTYSSPQGQAETVLQRRGARGF